MSASERRVPAAAGTGTTDTGPEPDTVTGAGPAPADPADPADSAGTTTGAVARRLGVSPATLRSWDRRYGIGPEVRRDGRHRRWAPRDIAVLEEMCRLTASGIPPAEAARAARAAGRSLPGDAESSPASPSATTPGASPGGPSGAPSPAAGHAPAAPPPTTPAAATAGESPVPAPRGAARQPGSGNGLPLGDVRQECRGLARAAVRLDAAAVEQLLASAVEQHGLVTAWEEVMVPTLRAAGRKWETAGDRYVEVEHLLSWHVSSALRRVPSAPPSPPGVPRTPPVLLACVPDEQHALPLEALAAGLIEQGFPVRMFGAALPAEALDAAVRRTGPAAVVLWSQSRSTANRPLARHVAASEWGVKGARTHPAVLLAGPGWAGPSVPGTLRPLGLREALEALGRLRRTVPAGPAVP
ncbi:MerR family transcriptional regulator [Streptomyces sp. MNU89]|uniref:MerR family transcriptional regulator n=1 Tax=Streptomyces sp. MNU89 TaxID=2560025 RepID=UPI001E37A34A|nr:MerR family transcriptional regulator [Streptomyces sp. MNU89]MCC9740218.1 MerR family transcriptional regulator [Streptomyces sp. MNU89]